MAHAARNSASRTAPSVRRVARRASRICPAWPRVADTTMTSAPSAAYLASVPPATKTSSSGWAKTPRMRGPSLIGRRLYTAAAHDCSRERRGRAPGGLALYNSAADVDALVDALCAIARGERKGHYEVEPATGDYFPRDWQPRFSDYFALPPSRR